MADHVLPLTRGALYILEGALQDMGPCTTPEKITRWSKVWNKVRKANDRTIKPAHAADGVDFEKPVIPNTDETQASFQKRVADHNEAFEVWGQQKIEIMLTDKQRDTCREALKFVSTKAKEARKPFQMSENLGVLFIALGFGSDSDDTDE